MNYIKSRKNKELLKNEEHNFLKANQRKINCDKCKHYNWYYDHCDKWNCTVDDREVHSCYEERISNGDTKRKDKKN